MIKVKSFIQDKSSLIPVEVELALWPGLPGIQFVGLPDQHLKESSIRIKSAIKACGFQFPVAQQILVNLRPSYLKKTSRGLELAVAAAYLWETEQLKKPLHGNDFYIYGELSLAGDVVEPEDLSQSFQPPHSIVLTGDNPKGLQAARFRRQLISNLKDLEVPSEIPACGKTDVAIRPIDLLKRKFSESQAKLLKILAVGEHSALIAGPAGSGKSTIAQTLPALLRKPSDLEFVNIKKIHHAFGETLQWRPVIKPHHSTPTIAMIGGGSVPFAGEISRAHGGILILDELLEFSSHVQEALREPFEEGKMRVFRNGKLKEFPAQAQILATTNLCPCGTWTPLKANERNCSLQWNRCRSYAPRLSGPLVDRFDLIEFTDSIGELEISGDEILEKVQKAQEFSLKRSPHSNTRVPIEILSSWIDDGSVLSKALESESSQRRKMAYLRVARTLADLDLSEKIETEHWREAKERCHSYFIRLKKWD